MCARALTCRVCPLCILSTEHCRACSLPGRREIVAMVITSTKTCCIPMGLFQGGGLWAREAEAKRRVQRASSRIRVKPGLELPLGGTARVYCAQNSRSLSNCSLVAEQCKWPFMPQCLPHNKHTENEKGLCHFSGPEATSLPQTTVRNVCLYLASVPFQVGRPPTPPTALGLQCNGLRSQLCHLSKPNVSCVLSVCTTC